jgi:hypothetical protein
VGCDVAKGEFGRGRGCSDGLTEGRAIASTGCDTEAYTDAAESSSEKRMRARTCKGGGRGQGVVAVELVGEDVDSPLLGCRDGAKVDKRIGRASRHIALFEKASSPLLEVMF